MSMRVQAERNSFLAEGVRKLEPRDEVEKW